MRLVVTRDDYFAAALDVLATSGHAALKIGFLCSSIGVTTGSFYHYFGSWDGFVLELLQHWEQEKTQRLAAAVNAETDPVQRVRTIKRMALGLPHDAETAIRAWSHTNPVVDEVQRRVDQERLDSIAAVIDGVVHDSRLAADLAVMGITLLVGVQQWRSPVVLADLERMLGEYEQLVLSHAAIPIGG